MIGFKYFFFVEIGVKEIISKIFGFGLDVGLVIIVYDDIFILIMMVDVFVVVILDFKCVSNNFLVLVVICGMVMCLFGGIIFFE